MYWRRARMHDVELGVCVLYDCLCGAHKIVTLARKRGPVMQSEIIEL